MQLHHRKADFEELIDITSKEYGLPASAVRKDYFITMVLRNLSVSQYSNCVVFKGGTSLSKCYPGTIDRFSEDIDLTFIPRKEMTDKQISKNLKNIENVLIGELKFEKNNGERNNRNKSCYVWFNDELKEEERIKLEIGSSVKPNPFSKKLLKSYIHNYLQENSYNKEIENYGFAEVELSVLDITRTFVDKIMAVKRHTICGGIENKTRHIYDVVRLYNYPEIVDFIKDANTLKKIFTLTKQTDSYYLQKRNLPDCYNPLEPYGFNEWSEKLNNDVKAVYENLHKNLLYTNEKQKFSYALQVFNNINDRLNEIGE